MDAAKTRTLFVLWLIAGAGGVRAQSPACPGTDSDLPSMLETEYTFGKRAQESIREAFLTYLADDSLVLQPEPTPGRAFYEAAEPSTDKLEWYPAQAAASGGLGFTTGPWIYSSASGKQAYGHFITIWKRDRECRWRAEFDGGVSHDPPAQAEPKLLPGAPLAVKVQLPAQKLLDQGAADQAMRDFQRTAQQDGIAAGLRTYARDRDFRFYVDGRAPMSAAAASQLLTGRSPVESWSENARGRSGDGALAYSVGVMTDSKQGGRHPYLQIWQYDPKVANWGLRILLENP